MKILSILPWADWLVLLFFGVMWIGYAQFASRWSLKRPSILAATNRFRLRWIKVSLSRDPRVLDGIITQTLSNTPAFFFIHHYIDYWWFTGLDGHHGQSG